MKHYQLLKLKAIPSLMQAELDDVTMQINNYLENNTEYSLVDIKTSMGGVPVLAIFSKEIASKASASFPADALSSVNVPAAQS